MVADAPLFELDGLGSNHLVPSGITTAAYLNRGNTLVEVSSKLGLQTPAVQHQFSSKMAHSHEDSPSDSQTPYPINGRQPQLREQHLNPSSQRIQTALGHVPRALRDSEQAFVDLSGRDPKERQVSQGFGSREGSSLSYDSRNLPRLKAWQVGAAIPPFNPTDVEDLNAVKKELANKAARESIKKGNREGTKIRSDIRDQARLKRDSRVRFSDYTPTSHPSIEFSVMDQKWGKLFDEGVPTQRLGQFLRGLANQMVSLAKW
jgi:hypothetical protein